MKPEKEMDMENKVYIKIESPDSAELKRNLLEISASTVKMQMIAGRFKEKTMHEIRERAVAKRHMRETAEAINEFIQKLPKVKEMHPIKKHLIGGLGEEHKREEHPILAPVERKSRKEEGFIRELEEIKRKISSL
jgi:quinol monooxygenase YgiN